MKQMIVDFLRDEEGLTTVEYAVAGGLVAAALVAVFTDLGEAARDKLQELVDAITGA